VIKKTINYYGFDNKPHTGDFYFHLSTAELMDIETSQEGGMAEFLGSVAKSGNAQEIMKQFKRFIFLAYGQRQDDGSFEKDDRSTEKFMKSPAFDALFLELVTSPDAVTEFVNGIIPRDLVAKLGEAEPVASELPWANREPTNKELTTMTQEQLLAVYKRRAEKQASQE
jgi:hypothetical protein